MSRPPAGAQIIRYVRVETNAGTEPDQATLAMYKLLEVMAQVWWPCAVTYIAMVDRDRSLHCGWTLTGTDTASVEAAATDLAALVTVVNPWLTVGAPALLRPWPEPPECSHELQSSSGRAESQVVTADRPLWIGTRSWGERWAITIALAGPTVAVASTGSVAAANARSGLSETLLGDAEDDLPRAGRSEPGMLTSVTLHSEGRRSEVIAALVGADCPPGYAVETQLVRGGAVLAPSAFPWRLLAHVMSAPVRIADGFPAHRVVSSEELFAAIEGGPTPHVLLIGASGQGKSSLLANMADRASEAGESVFCVDVADGHFADQVAQAARTHGREPVVVDFGDEATAQTLRITQAPPGVTGAQWATQLYEILRDVLWADMPAEYFGPVGERALRLILTVLTTDPAGPAPLTDVPRLLDVGDASHREAVLARIDDPELRRSFAREVMPMLTAKEPGNSALWLISKLEPLIGQPAVAAALNGAADTTGLQRAVEAGATIVVNAPASRLGDSGSRIVVAVLLHRTWLQLRRDAAPVGSGRSTGRLSFILDEWQRYPIPTLASMLAESRKYGVRLVLANQNLAQLPRALRDTVLGNIGTLGCFRMGPADAQLLASMFSETTTKQLQTLRPHHLAVVAGDRELVALAPAPLKLPSGGPA